MGRTLQPFSQLIEQERRAWAPFRRPLRQAEQAPFDRLFDCAKLHVQAGVYLSRPWPFKVIAMAILLEEQKLLERPLAQVKGPELRLSGEIRDALGPGVWRELPFGSLDAPWSSERCR